MTTKKKKPAEYVRWRYFFHVDCPTCGKRKSYWSYHIGLKPEKWEDRNEIHYHACGSHF